MKKKSLVSGLIINRYSKASILDRKSLDDLNSERRLMLKNVHFDGQVESALNDLR